MLRVQLLGVPSFRIRGRPAQSDLGQAGRLLSSFLFAFCEQPFRREYLQELFWGDLPAERGRAALNTAIWRLRKLLSQDDPVVGAGLQVNRAEVLLRMGDDLVVDSVVFTAEARELLRATALGPADITRLQRCADLYEGTLLEGEDAHWVMVERERLQALYIQLVSRLADLQTRLGLYDDAIASTRSILRIDPFREGAHRDLLILLALNGERASAFRHYERLSALLRQELDLPPPAEAAGLIGVLRQEDYRGHFERLRGERFPEIRPAR